MSIGPPPSDAGHRLCRPTEKVFHGVCNELWWVSTYVAQGLVRQQLIYAKTMLETVVRPMFLTMLAFSVRAEEAKNTLACLRALSR